jgi:hypothetical protein
VLVPAIIPYTVLVMGVTNQKLQEKADSLASASLTDASAEAGVSKSETTHALVDQWANFNVGRALLGGVGAVCAIWATVNKVEVVGLGGIQFSTGANRLG